MLDSETKRRIDSARDILVGKLPDPKSQVEQITIALIYKFMDDMDGEAVELGGKASFFVDDYEKYGWRKIFDPRLGGFEMLSLYSEAIVKLNQNPKLPQLFRDIFKNAYLPYRDPETLKLFLKTINEFRYDHSERLGDAFEYLLSVLGSQGDAGQFRTPRHIIDFIVSIVDPKKGDTICDPACGTAGFLISAYKHIIKNNPHLTPDERRNLMENVTGYDISPDMVRLSLVNMYLHGFKTPKIFEYDTLTSEERWKEYFDVIMANPPFMSPKGGIKPHKKFSVEANRSEVLFVDYIAEHINPTTGRAGIIVPEGIIFQATNAYSQLRKNMVQNWGLYCVLSLPSGLFQPYSGVKTSLLFFDKALSNIATQILFCDVRNTGISLGATNTPIKENDLPQAKDDIRAFKDGSEIISSISFIVDRNDIIGPDYNLSLSRYRQVIAHSKTFELRKLKEVATLTKGRSSSTKSSPGEYPLYLTAEKQKTSDSYDYEGDGVAVPLISALGHGKAAIKRIHRVSGRFALADLLAFVEPDSSTVDPSFLYYLLNERKDQMAGLMSGAANVAMKVADLAEFQIPVPSIALQKEIVQKIKACQLIIDGAMQVIQNYKPRIDISPDWKTVKLGDVCDINSRSGTPAELFGDTDFVYIDISSVENKTGVVSFENVLSTLDAPSRARRLVKTNDILLSTVRPNLMAFGFLNEIPARTVASTGFAVLTIKQPVVPKFIYRLLFEESVVAQMIARMEKGAYPSITQQNVAELSIPLPPTEAQIEVVEQLDKEEALVNANREISIIFEAKIKREIDNIWED